MKKPEEFTKSIQKAVDISPKRKFKQSVELIINLKGLNMKKADNQIELYVHLPESRGRENKVCGLVGPELQANAKESCDQVVLKDDFKNFDGKKKEIKKLAQANEFFIAQAPLMGEIAKVFGRVLGPRGKMPNPKAGCVVPPNANLKVLAERLKNTIKVAAKVSPEIKCMIGKEDQDIATISKNVAAVYNAVVAKLPQEENNVKSVVIKFTMGPPIKLGSEDSAVFIDPKKARAEKREARRAAQPAPRPKAEPVEEQEPEEKKEEPKVEEKKAAKEEKSKEEVKEEPKAEKKEPKEELKESAEPEEKKEEAKDKPAPKSEEKPKKEPNAEVPEKKEEPKEEKKTPTTDDKIEKIVEKTKKAEEPKPSAEKIVEEVKEEHKEEDKKAKEIKEVEDLAKKLVKKGTLRK